MGQAKITDDGSNVFKKSPMRCNYKQKKQQKKGRDGVSIFYYFQIGAEVIYKREEH